MLDDSASLCYQSSGRVGLAGPLLMALCAGVAATLLGFLYGYAIYYCPLIYINFFITAFYGAAVGLAAGWAGRVGKIRNEWFMMGGGVVAGLVGTYAGWVAWIYAFSGQEALLLAPGELWQAVTMVADQGAWSIFGVTPTGIFLYLIWLIEAGIIVVSCMLFAFGYTSDTPFCETCQAWIDDERSFGPLLALSDDTEVAQDKFERGDFSDLRVPEAGTEPTKSWVTFTLRRCDRCEDQSFLTVTSLLATVDKDGEANTESTEVVDNLIVTKQQHADLIARYPAMA